MTVPSETNKNVYNGNGVQDEFVYSFKILDDDDIKVEIKNTTTGAITTLVKTTDYTVSGVDTATGTITLVSPSTSAPSGTQVILTRSVPQTQEVDYVEYDAFPAETHERALDKLTMIAQQQQEQIGRSFKADPGLQNFSDIIENLSASNATYVIRINTDGDALEAVASNVVPLYAFPVGTGILVQVAPDTAALRTIEGTPGAIAVADGDGLNANPAIDLEDNLDFSGKTIADGVYAPSAFADSSDNTKRIHFDLSGVSASTTRNVTWQDVPGTVYVSSGTDVTVSDGGSGRSTATAYGVICGGTTSTGAHQSVAVGSSGQVLTSNGASQLPTMQSFSRVQNYKRTVYTSSTTHNWEATLRNYHVTVVAPGAAGGSVLQGGSGNSGAGGGGGAGAIAHGSGDAAAAGATASLTIGAAGAPGAAGNNAGGSGGNSSIDFAGTAPTITANGGVGGSGSTSVSTNSWALGGLGGTTTNSEASYSGAPGGYAYINGGTLAISGVGGSSQYGGGGRTIASNNGQSNGNAGTGYGSGGSGGVCSNTLTSVTGGAGAPSMIIVEEWY